LNELKGKTLIKLWKEKEIIKRNNKKKRKERRKERKDTIEAIVKIKIM